MDRLFGTDGVRGIANKDLTPDLAYKLGVSGARVLAGKTKHKPKILIGMDTRISCGMLEASLSSGICSAGADVIQVGVLPTPAVAFLTRHYRCDAGVMISASHNSYEYNGIKFFSADGFKLPDTIEDEIEKLVEKYDNDNWERPIGANIGHRSRRREAAEEYIYHLKEIIDADFSGMKIGMDCANGASSAFAPKLFQDLGASVYAVATTPDGININEDCGSTHIEKLSNLVIDEKLDFGLAFDGDADRLLAIDSQGDLVDGDVVLAIIGKYLKEKGELNQNTIVATVMSNLGLSIFGEKSDINIEKTKVGDRYVLEKMRESGLNFGGEQSGHVILLDYSTTGDGMLTALFLTKIMCERRDSLHNEAKIIHILPQVQKTARVPNENKVEAMDDNLINSEIEKISAELKSKGRILVRPSGTEPVIRVMIEGDNHKQIERMAAKIADLIVKRHG